MGTKSFGGRRAAWLFILLALPAARLLPGCRTDLVTGVSGEVNDSLRIVYHDDAARLALRSMHGTTGPGRNVDIPADSIDYYLNRLVDIWVHASRMKKQDSLEMMLGIHAFNNPSLYNVVLTLDPGLEWAESWHRSNPETGNTEVNRLIRQHKLKMENYNTIQTSAYAVISADRPINTYALADLFRKIPGVRSAEPETSIGGGQDIQADYTAKGLMFTYWRGAGDCTAGCIYKKSWDFFLDNKGMVIYTGTRGYLPKDTMTSYH